MKSLRVIGLSILLSVFAGLGYGHADEVSFTGEVSDDWHDGNNWSDGFEPEGFDDYFIQDEHTAIYSTGTNTINKLVVGDTSPGTFIMTGGDLTVDGGGDSFQIGRGCCDAVGTVELMGDAILRTTLNSGVGERDRGVLHIGPDAAVISPDAYWRVGNFGPKVDSGLEGDGLLDVEGTFQSRSLFIGVQDGTGVVKVRGTGSILLTPFADGDPLAADINMNFNHDPVNHPNQSGTLHMIGSQATVSARTLQSQHDAASPIKNLLWFTADAEGVSPIELSEEVNIDNNKLRVDLSSLETSDFGTLLLVDAAPGEIQGTFAELEVIGGLDAFRYSVLYDQTVGDILLQAIANCADGFGCGRSDISQNGMVDFADFLQLSGDFGNSVPPADPRSDINQDGSVNFADFLILSSDFGKTVQPLQAATVPEPHTMKLMLFGVLALGVWRRTRSQHRTN